MGSSSTQKLEATRCKAAVCWGAEEVVVEEIEVAPPRESEVRVKMLCASLCHTDVLYWKSFPWPLYPRVLGHEGVGVLIFGLSTYRGTSVFVDRYLRGAIGGWIRLLWTMDL